MELTQIVTLANRAVRLRFLVMERSLRAVGCDLPVRVIPYDDSLFELPPHSEWWEDREILSWLGRWGSHPMMRKYQCLTIGGYNFVDADVCFVRNPADVLQPHSGFVTSCGHWHNPDHTLSNESRSLFAAKSTVWQSSVFNAGQWASDAALYSQSRLRKQAELPEFSRTCLTFPFHDQPGLNLLVAASGVTVTNLTLPPYRMESTWAGDYPGPYRHYWTSEMRTPFLVHWAGTPMDRARPINEIFYSFLTTDERKEWEESVARETASRRRGRRTIRARLRRWWRGAKAFQEAVRSA